MVHRFCIEALHKSLKDIFGDSMLQGTSTAFGGRTVIFGGDFRQILPVIPSGTKADILNATMCNSQIWHECEVYTLKLNMRLMQPHMDDHRRDELNQFAQWLLNIGDGKISSTVKNNAEDGDWIVIPNDFLINEIGDPLDIIFRATYIDFEQKFSDPLYLRQRAIVTPHNDVVDQINSYILEKMPGPLKTYHSCDTLSKSSIGSSNQEMLYPPEVLNTINFPGVPSHVLNLKISVVVMLLRNIRQINGLCNGTRLLITQLESNIIEATIITGEHLGEKVFIPKIVFTVKDKKWPFIFNRRQFPLRLSYAMTINKSQGQTLDIVGGPNKQGQTIPDSSWHSSVHIRAFIVVRIVRLWKTILPPHNEFISIYFLAVDDQKNAMHGTIPSEYSADFEDHLMEGNVYKINMFQVTKRKQSHNAVPLQKILYLSSTTRIEQINDNLDKYPQHYFQFATMDDIIARTDREYFMTGEKFLATSSASKIYINLDIPETAELKERAKNSKFMQKSAASISAEDGTTNHVQFAPLEWMMEMIVSTVRGMYATESDTPRRKWRTKAVVFGPLAEKLSRYQLTSSVISKGVHNDQLPEELKAIIDEEYIFTVGLTDQASDQVLLKYKIFAFLSNSPAPVSVNRFKGKDIAESVCEDDETENAATLTSDAMPTELFSDESPAKK
ncbi:ATP-dependent DNA helicase pif1 [Phtheirospermum japonicum]|uniref:ATP-dependent DNA helicase n=1 Tax=Phtheirospermum japonicum TaxID=374723 RepID=A0A830D2J4_9LAMI|nr:ATP-dependent DNA helicase pif1 [Phtheirospermum japonicum]